MDDLVPLDEPLEKQPAPPQPGLERPPPIPANPQPVPGDQPVPRPKMLDEKSLYPANVSLTPKMPALEKDDVALPINLAAALRLADGGRPLIIQAAQASAWVAEAQLAHARTLWVPHVNIGVSYTRHDGNGLTLNGLAPSNANENINFVFGGVGFTQNINLVDAIFEPLALRRTLTARRWDIQTAMNDALLQAALAYFSVHEQRGRYAGAVDVVEKGTKLVETIEKLQGDLVPRVEVERARNALDNFKQQMVTARENWRIQSANLTQVLRLDPRAVVVPIEPDHLQITLIDPLRPLDDLVPVGLTNRPELASQQALVQAVLVRIRQEKMRPILPSVVLSGYQTPSNMYNLGFTAYGSGANMDQWSLRDDFNIQLIWQLEGFGFGNLARIKQRRAEQSETIVDLFKIQDAVAAEVTQTQAQIQSAAMRVGQAENDLQKALITFEGNLRGLKETEYFQEKQRKFYRQIYRPQEVVVSLEHVKTAYDYYFTTVADYNRAQFQMYHALGYPARDIERLRSPGDPIPVDTTRPLFLPPVSNGGPPPATR